MINHERSRELYAAACKVIPGGVNSPVRAFGSVGGEPPYIVRGEGSHIWDADGNEYVDYIGSWGPLILGHAAPAVVDAVIAAARKGTSFGASTPAEADLAELVISAFPHMQKVRFVSSGTEATMSARFTAQRAAAARSLGRPPGPEGSIGKLASSDIARQAARVHGQIAGAHGFLLV